MSQLDKDQARLAYLVGGGGMVITALIFILLLIDTQADLDITIKLGDYLPFVILILGSTVSFLLTMIMRSSIHINRQSAQVTKIKTDLMREEVQRISAEEAQQKLEIALLQGQKLQAIGTLAGGIAHDFNNILYAIIGYTELSKDDVAKDSQTYHNLEKVIEASKRGQELVSRILAFSRHQKQNQEKLNLNRAIESALALLRPAIPASVEIRYEPHSDAEVLANQTQLHQILVNIINNAVDAMDGDGIVTVELSNVPANDPILRSFSDLQSGPHCKLEITDTGHGMDKHAIDRIFEPFYTTKEVGKGTGLGLSIVHTIVKDHKGAITVQSQLGHGTKFMILLPLYSGEGA